MKNQLVLGLAIAIGSGSAVQAGSAQILAAGSLYGGPTQTRAVCYIFNAGPSANVVGIDIYDQNGVPVPKVIDQCGGPLAFGQSCGVAGDITNNSSYSCIAQVRPNKSEVRGILEVRDANQNSLTNIEMR
jgi:hypothetical protein